ncbi:phenylacetate--CoA ligase family protein [Amycolatopsis samaneae]|uniref:Phenylacetate-CoA ligase n=1 Tax=Amycolatopsis samaneae TaxID=664691 RepID=A0ABW5GCQ7_9PSEU
MTSQPPAEMVDAVRDIPLYRESLARGEFPILEKERIARGFPDNWMTPELRTALDSGDAEFVLSTGTNHARMQLIRPPYFLLKSYYRLWSEHPDIAHTWEKGCPRVSLTTVLATQHVARVNARARGEQPAERPGLADRRLDERTVYVNQRLDPALWTREDVAGMLDEIERTRAEHPSGSYHLDCSSYHLAHLAGKARQWGLADRLPRPDSIVHAYEYTPDNVARFLRAEFDCPIVDLFGSTELGYLYYSDGEGRYHPYLDRMRVELVPVEAGSTLYSLIVSSIRNPYMPLIRYRSGDCARTVDGSPDPARIARFCGREKELVRVGSTLLCHGDLDRWIGACAPPVFLYRLRVGEGSGAELEYTTFDGGPLDAPAAASLVAALAEHLELSVEPVHRRHIPIGKSGKYAWLHPESRDH